jgi:uncharacterized membrane protein
VLLLRKQNKQNVKASDFLSKEEESKIIDAIASAEKNTSGEIRVHIEKKCKNDVLDRSAFIFAKLKIHKTALRNGVLFYLAIEDKKFAILGDTGINNVVPDGFWDHIKDEMAKEFSQLKFADGLIKGIDMAGEKLKSFFPYQKDDVNELPDDISFGK